MFQLENTHSPTRETHSVCVIGKHLSKVALSIPAAFHPALLEACHWSLAGSGTFLAHRIHDLVDDSGLVVDSCLLPQSALCSNSKFLQIFAISNRTYRPGQRMKLTSCLTTKMLLNSWSSEINSAPQLYGSALVNSLSCSICAAVGLVVTLFQFYFWSFFSRPTDPKSENKFGNKRKQKNGDGLWRTKVLRDETLKFCQK